MVADFLTFITRYKEQHGLIKGTSSRHNNMAVQVLGAKRRDPPEFVQPVTPRARPAPPSPADEAAEDPPDSEDGSLADIADDTPLQALLPSDIAAQQPEKQDEVISLDDEMPYMPKKPGNLAFGMLLSTWPHWTTKSSKSKAY